MTQLAVIPPNSLQAQYSKRPYQLLVPQQLVFSDYTPPPETFIILDNGAAEGDVISAEEMDKYDAQVCANEWVIPDVIGDAPATLREVLRFHEEYISPQTEDEMKYMAVVQGENLDQQLLLIRRLVDIGFVTTLGLPRHMLSVDRHARILLCSAIFGKGWHERFEVHFLGTYPGYLKELKLIPDWVRGVDTSAPFNYAYAGASVEDDAVCKRPEGYFGLIFNPKQEALAEKNIATMEGWLNGRK